MEKGITFDRDANRSDDGIISFTWWRLLVCVAVCTAALRRVAAVAGVTHGGDKRRKDVDVIGWMVVEVLLEVMVCVVLMLLMKFLWCCCLKFYVFEEWMRKCDVMVRWCWCGVVKIVIVVMKNEVVRKDEGEIVILKCEFHGVMVVFCC